MADTGVWGRQLIFQYAVTIETLVKDKVVGHEFISVRERVYFRSDRFTQSIRVMFRCELKHEVTRNLMQTVSYHAFSLDKYFFFMAPRTLLPRRRRKPHEVAEISGYEREHRGMFRTVTTLTPVLRQRLSATFNAGLG